jgi:DNA-binding transcriptional LysR family regulator
MSVREDHTSLLLAALASGQVDAAFVGLPPRRRLPSDVDGTVIEVDPVVLAVHPDHELAHHGSISLGHLRDQPMVTLPTGSGQRAMLDAAAHAAGFTPRIIAESSQLTFLLELAATGVGAALVPETAARASTDLAITRITRPRLERRLTLVWRSATVTPAARAFLALAHVRLAGAGKWNLSDPGGPAARHRPAPGPGAEP